MPVTEITTEEQLRGLITAAPLAVLNFWAPWAQQCQQMNEVFTELSRQYAHPFLQIEAEQFPDVAEGFEIEAVPTFVLLKAGKPVERVNGADIEALSAAIQRQSNTASQVAPTTTTSAATATVVATAAAAAAAPAGPRVPPTQQRTPEELNQHLYDLTHQAPVVIFIKGSPDVPRCGFSKQLVNLLNTAEVRYQYFDILGDEQVRQALKVYSDWPTYPQLYIGGELQGGLDIVKELNESGDLQSMVQAATQEAQ